MKNKLFIPLIFSAVLLLSPYLNFGQTAPALGTAADFILFTASGEISNTSISNFIGNIGSNSDMNSGLPISGFGNVNGQIHNIDAVSAQCYTDAAAAFSDLLLRIPTRPDPSIAGILGNGDTLKKGVYQITLTTSLNGNLILDGEGNPNAVFIFKTGSALNSAIGAKIILINSALACNIFWQVNGNVTLSSLTNFKGSILTNGAISFSTMDTLVGRALTLGGTVTTSGTTAAIPVDCNGTPLTGPARPTLGSLVDYELYSADGQIGNGGIISRVAYIGPSYIVGNIGTNHGIISGFEPPSEVIGTVNINNASTAQAATDLEATYTDVNGLPYYTKLLSTPTFGNDLTLTPHTYFLDGPTLLTGNLTLDAQGNADAIFVIQVNGDFSSGIDSKVILKDSAKACNIFWKLEGLVTLGINSIFKGTIISNSSIDLQLNTILDGRALTRSGNITLDTDTARIPTDCVSRPLPLTLVNFEAQKANNEDVLLTWNIQNEVNTKYFDVEVSGSIIQNGESKFHTIGLINAKGLGNISNNYTFIDKEINKSGIRYYRLKMIDKNGLFTYSNVKILKFDKKTLLISEIYPNPVQKVLNLSIYSETSDRMILTIINVDGKKMINRDLKINKGTNNLNEDISFLSGGMYVITIINIRDGSVIHKNFQKL